MSKDCREAQERASRRTWRQVVHGKSAAAIRGLCAEQRHAGRAGAECDVRCHRVASVDAHARLPATVDEILACPHAHATTSLNLLVETLFPDRERVAAAIDRDI